MSYYKSYVQGRIRQAHVRQDNVDFMLIITWTSNIHSLSVVTADKGYDSEG